MPRIRFTLSGSDQTAQSKPREGIRGFLHTFVHSIEEFTARPIVEVTEDATGLNMFIFSREEDPQDPHATHLKEAERFLYAVGKVVPSASVEPVRLDRVGESFELYIQHHVAAAFQREHAVADVVRQYRHGVPTTATIWDYLSGAARPGQPVLHPVADEETAIRNSVDARAAVAPSPSSGIRERMAKLAKRLAPYVDIDADPSEFIRESRAD